MPEAVDEGVLSEPGAATDQPRIAVVLVNAADPSGYQVEGVLVRGGTGPPLTAPG